MAGTLVILRHGQSTWNLENLFTGWRDVPLTPLGEEEARAAGRTIADSGITFDTSHTSVGGTIYADPLAPVRPLVQVGATFSRNHTFSIVNGLGDTAIDRETELLLTAGVEADLNDWLALRALVDINTEDSLGDSTFLGDIIAWPSERVFLRGGVIKPLDGDTVGGHIGAGLTF